MSLEFHGGNIIASLPFWARVWRPVQTVTHDRVPKTPTHRDVYESDIPARLRPDTVSLDFMATGSPSAESVMCLLPARDSTGTRIRVYTKDILEIKWTRQDGPRRRLVATTLTDSAVGGTTALRVKDTWGFEAEDSVLLETADEDDWFRGWIESVVGDTITLRSSRAVPSDKSFEEGDAVRVAWTARVMSTRNPFQSDMFNIVSVGVETQGKWFLE